MVVQHNLPALNSHRNLGINNAATAKNLEKLSSGYRINRAGDDAAGLAISEKMRGQIRGLAMAENNASNGISLIQTAEGGLNETHSILQRMRELSVQSANGTYKDEDRQQIAKEVQALKSEIDRIATSTHYNNINLLDGTTGGTTLLSAENALQGAALTALENAVGGNHSIALNGNTNFDPDARATLSIVYARNANGQVDNTRAVFSLQVGDRTYTTMASSATGAITLYYNGDASTETDYGSIAMTINLSGGNNIVQEGAVSGIEMGSDYNGSVDLRDRAMNYGVAGAKTDKLVFQIGANGTSDQRVGLHVDNMSSGAIGSFVAHQSYNRTGTIAGIDVATREAANHAISVIDAATKQVSGTRAELGALQNRLEHTLNNLGVTKENLTAAESSIRDVDMAKEMMEFTKNNILVQASQAMLAQANALPQGVLSLLR